MMLAGWINRHQQDVIEYLKTENKILREKLGRKRILLNDEQRKKLAVLGKRLGRKVLLEACCAFSPDTILKWHRKLVAMKYDSSGNRKAGRPQISDELKRLIIKIAQANRSWGYIRLQGQLKYLGYRVSHKTIAKILKEYGLEPSPDRAKRMTWNDFIKAHWQSLAAIDFFTTEIYTLKGLTRYMVLIVIDYTTRKVEVAGIIQQAHGQWMKQIAASLTDPLRGFLKDKKCLIHDRDPLFTKGFIKILRSAGIRTVKTLPLAPNLTPFVERFIRSIKSECLDRMLIFGERHLHYIIEEYVKHYHQERPHQGIDNNIIEPPPQGRGQITCHERLGGLLKSYRRAA
ncbi:MAG: integrase core domain-containing protein [Planctomycetota bacterium]|jgi:transposase InsO family protein